MAEGGLINMGLTCYANSVLQALRHCKKIPWIFEEGRYNTLFYKESEGSPIKAVRAKQESLTSSFANVVQLLQKCKRGQNVRPADLWLKFGQCVDDTGFEHLRIKMSHDSHEFFLCLLDILHESLAQETDMRIIRAPPVTSTDMHCIQALEVWRKQFTKQYSPLVDLFYGLQHIIVTCSNCKHQSHRWETFTSLKASIHPSNEGQNIFDLLKEEWKPETISDYACDKCAPARQTAVQTISIWRLPYYLTFVIKRFTQNGMKIGTPVAPLPKQGEEPISFETFFSEESPEKVEGQTYRLHSIVDHHGGASGGHYTAQCRYAGALDGERKSWRVFDDQNVHDIPLATFGSSTYMMWFERT